MRNGIQLSNEEEIAKERVHEVGRSLVLSSSQPFGLYQDDRNSVPLISSQSLFFSTVPDISQSCFVDILEEKMKYNDPERHQLAG